MYRNAVNGFVCTCIEQLPKSVNRFIIRLYGDRDDILNGNRLEKIVCADNPRITVRRILIIALRLPTSTVRESTMIFIYTKCLALAISGIHSNFITRVHTRFVLIHGIIIIYCIRCTHVKEDNEKQIFQILAINFDYTNIVDFN